MSREYTIILVSEKSGKNFSFKMRLPIILLLLISLVVFIGLTYFSMSRYVSLNQQNLALKTALDETRKKVGELAIDNSESALYNKWADKIIYRRINNDSVAAEDQGSDNTVPAEPADNSTKTESLPLGIDDLNIRRINLEKDFDFSFNLVNTKSKHIKQSGFVFVIVSNDTTVPEISTSFPESKIINGNALNYTEGIPFSIRYMKKISGRILQPDIGEKYNRINMLVYSENGNILMEKGFYIERTLNNNPYE